MLNDLVLQYEGSWALFAQEVAMLSHQRHFKKIIGRDKTYFLSIGTQRYYKNYLLLSEVEESQSSAITAYANSKLMNQIKSEIEILLNRMMEFTEEFDKNSLDVLFEEYCSLYIDYLAYYNITSDNYCRKVWDHIREAIPNEYTFARDDIFHALTATSNNDLLSLQEIKYFLNLYEKYKSDENIEASITDYLTNFKILAVSSAKPEGESRETLMNRLKTMSEEEYQVLKQKYKIITSTARFADDWATATRARYNISDYDNNIIINIRDMPYLRLKMREVFQKYKMRAKITFLKEISLLADTYVDKGSFDYMTINEILELIRANKKPSIDLIAQRKNAVIMEYEEGQVSIHINKKAFEPLNSISNNDEKKFGKGTPVYGRGKSVLKVLKIVQDKKGLDAISNLGYSVDELKDIVILSNTIKPHLISLCNKCGGIITQEGGFTSHAAVLCRELGIPCIVGMANAMSIFDNNDTIEIDYSEGIARKKNVPIIETSKSSINYVQWLNDKNIEGSIIGRKAANINHISSYARVPNGFVINNYATKVIYEGDAKDKEMILETVRSYIDILAAKTIAIRSSHQDEDNNTNSFAGLFKSFINVPTSDFDHICILINEVIASQFDQTVLAYKCTEQNQMSVIIQEMVKADISGVLLTSKVYDGYEYALIEYVWGDLAHIMDGNVRPLRTYVKKCELSKLPLSQICIPPIIDSSFNYSFNDLGTISLLLEKDFLTPLEIEWAIKDNQLIILQVRPQH